ARQQDAGRSERLIALGHLVCDARKHLAHVRSFSLDGIAQYMDSDSRLASHRRRGFQGHLRRGDRNGAGVREPRIAGFHGLCTSTLEQFENGLWEFNAMAAPDVERVRWGGGIRA